MNLRHHHPPDSWALILRGTWLSLLLLLLNTGCTITPHTTPFVIGLYGVDDTNTFREIRNLGVDIITGSSEVRFLDAAHRHGLRVFASLGTTAGLDFDPVQARRSILHADRHPARTGAPVGERADRLDAQPADPSIWRFVHPLRWGCDAAIRGHLKVYYP